MQASQRARLEQLEVLYSEQDYLVQTLNTTVARQEKEILRLARNIEHILAQMQALKNSLGDGIDASVEKPPHY